MADQQYDNRNRGVLFRVDEKRSEKSPDLLGNIDVNGVEHQLSGWRKVSKNGVQYLSLSIRRKDADTAKPKNETAKPAGAGAAPFDDAVPFGPEFR
jgi:hypothetical protein